MGKRTGIADLPLHRGRVPAWLAERMAALAGAVTEAILLEYGPLEFLSRLSDPAWFQSFGCVLGMDWHSSGMTTAVMGALKRALADRSKDLGLYVCGGRGRHSRRTPEELLAVAEATGLDGDALVRTSRLVARVDNNAVADGHQIYLHSFVLTEDGHWAIVQQGMRPETKTARRYHWHSDQVRDFVEEPHEGIVGENQGEILNLTDRRARRAKETMIELAADRPETAVHEFEKIRRLVLPARHALARSDVVPRRLEAVLRLAAEEPPAEFSDLLLLPGLGPRTLEALALVSEVVYGTPVRFEDPARFAFAHGGKDGHPHPVLTKVYDETLASLRRALDLARIGRTEKLRAFRRLEAQLRRLEAQLRRLEAGPVGPGRKADPVSEAVQRGWAQSPELGGRTVGQGPPAPPEAGRTNERPRKRSRRAKAEQLSLPGLGLDAGDSRPTRPIPRKK